MTTPDVRTWARENGYDVSDRGRLPAEVRTAYDKAHAGAKPAKKAAAPPAKKAAAPPAKKKPAVAPQPPVAESSTPAAGGTLDPAAKPAPVSDDRRLVALAEELKALTARVDQLEKARPSAVKPSLFRRKSR